MDKIFILYNISPFVHQETHVNNSQLSTFYYLYHVITQIVIVDCLNQRGGPLNLSIMLISISISQTFRRTPITMYAVNVFVIVTS